MLSYLYYLLGYSYPDPEQAKPLLEKQLTEDEQILKELETAITETSPEVFIPVEDSGTIWIPNKEEIG